MNSYSDLMNLPFALFTGNLITHGLTGSIRKTNNESLKLLDRWER